MQEQGLMGVITTHLKDEHSAAGSITRQNQDKISAGLPLPSRDLQSGQMQDSFSQAPKYDGRAQMAQRIMGMHGDGFQDYDQATADAAGQKQDKASGGHGGDFYKQPNHPTFSTGSQLSQPGLMGGSWTAHGGKQFSFEPSGQNLTNMPGNKLPTYFATGERQGTVLHMPNGRNFEGSLPYNDDVFHVANRSESNPSGQTSPYRTKSAGPPDDPNAVQDHSMGAQNAMLRLSEERAARNGWHTKPGSPMGATSPSQTY